MTRWKNVERGIARHLGGRRVPITGRQRGDVPDVSHDWLSIEVKTRKALPQWIKDGMAQAIAARRDAQLPVLILHQKQQPYLDSLISMHLRDFLEWFSSPEDLFDIKEEIEESEADANG